MAFPVVPAGVKILSVGEITRNIKAVLEERFPWVWVEGEISNYKPNRSGHVYLTLKDGEAVLGAVIYRDRSWRIKFEPHDGMQVIARGRLLVYGPQGKYQLAIEDLFPKGLGAREAALRQLREKLSRLGWFDSRRKKPLPRFPRRIALITSPTGAAVGDLLDILGRRWPAAEVWVCPAMMQGDGAGVDIARTVRLLNHVHQQGTLSCDVMILGRGGGSIEDLWAFNEEIVARAIFESVIPVVSAVGHEIDITIADQVADHRAPTPSKAAADVVPDRRELLDWLRQTTGRLEGALRQGLAERRQRLDDLADRRSFRLPLERIQDLQQRLDDQSGRLERALRHRLGSAGERLQALADQLESLSPLNVLRRGYSLTRKEADQVVVRRPDQVEPGDRLVSIVQHGRIVSRVETVDFRAADPASLGQGGSPAARMQS